VSCSQVREAHEAETENELDGRHGVKVN
jgi:hypothetical protein